MYNIMIFYFYHYPPADGENHSLSSPHFHVFSYTSCVDLTQLHFRNPALAGVPFGSRNSDSASCPYHDIIRYHIILYHNLEKNKT